ncbi:MAG: hypothetical protein PHD43_18760 [Methylococcales bacterium]|nr:hypothetical protein [Methylococcales bacterium]
MSSSYAIGGHFNQFIHQQIESCPGIPTENVFARLKAKYQATLERRA